MSNNQKAMKNSWFLVILISLFLSSCGPGQLFGPTFTPSPTFTLTPTITPSPTSTSTFTPTLTPTLTATFTPASTPIPGIGVPLVVNSVSIRILSAVVGDKLPEGFALKSPGFFTPLRVESIFSGNNGQREYNQAVIVDESGYKTGWELIVTSTSSNSTPITTLYYAVKKTANRFSLRLSNGQMIDLTSILKFK